MQETEFKPFMTRRTEDGQWECYHHAVHELTATGHTEAEAQSKVLKMCETVINVNHHNLERWYDRAKAAEATLVKARAVLAENPAVIKRAHRHIEKWHVNDTRPFAELIVALADALGGEHE